MDKVTGKLTLSFVVGFSVVHCLAALVTVIRVVHRKKRQQLWWDDLFASIASFATLFLTGTTVAAYLMPEGGYPYAGRAFLFWIGLFLTPTVIWSGRVAVLNTIAYYLPPDAYPARLTTIWSSLGFAIAWIATLISKIFVSGLPIRAIPQPPFSKAATIFGLVLNLLGTAWLIGWPAYLLVKLSLGKSYQRLILTCFVFTTTLGAWDIWHAINTQNTSPYLFYSSHLELLFSVLVANVGWFVAVLVGLQPHKSQVEVSSDSGSR
ncbi:hypothetical protein CC1G_09280 [Coprinopsis cinerea okayama7|uniref:Integral membrane protein n=1 Tax=Coprinopsis cinerea (strain Okayama-7 / 130 / ATCC MYA-4618 / FGSC 9003) TaxID=240176 RepID=A8N859_COPC7|nr:hypothetical protein CC1G_09280 [Coprinopsis cinerea okayama7\|eukprot:XP_001831015.1 hypothetical protein CC1G_09280 [Coprinopsis cinerea okayama7\